MNEAVSKNILDGNVASFIDGSSKADPRFKPHLLTNDYKEGRKVLCTISDELSRCDEFIISVAFITMGGLTPLLMVLKELEEKGIKGKILTTDYLTFTEPKALEKLQSLKNIELRMYCTANDDDGFHTKGYLFRKDSSWSIIIGSSNLTKNALTVNKEWNARLISTGEGEFRENIMSEFMNLWESERTKPYGGFFEDYSIRYRESKTQKDLVRMNDVVSLSDYKLTPNIMQTEFIRETERLYNAGEKRALLVSATGTGKTFASAFAIRNLNPKKILFVVHREQIAVQALNTFQRVFGADVTMGLLSGYSKDMESDFLFSTMQMMAKEETRKNFSPSEFDIIVIDEAHRTGAESYRKIMDYFTPRFWLGMTASPERTDDFDIYSLFHHNVACEIRLQHALEENLLCPFHYFGISDFKADGITQKSPSDFKYLEDEKRADHVIEKLKYYGYSGDRPKGLIFCSRNSEAARLSEIFNKKGYRTVSLSGSENPEKRREAIERLAADYDENALDYIFTVDIFNEGIDIPEINQVVLLRPTQSPIIFVQQLGRGLRKADKKEYVVILDFIANYERNNYMIPMALSGDRSYNKDNLRRYLREGSRIIPGASTISFDEISRKRIYESIDRANFNEVSILKESYNQLKMRTGKIPTLMDFETFGSVDPLRIFENKSIGSYYMFLTKYESEYNITLSDTGNNMLEYVSRKFASGKRPHELLALKLLMEGTDDLLEDFERIITSYPWNLPYTPNTGENLVNLLINGFIQGTGKNTYSRSIFIKEKSGRYLVSDEFEEALITPEFKDMMEELISFGLMRNRKDYSKTHDFTPFNLYSKYNYEDVMRLLDWKRAEVAQNIGGYKYDEGTKTYPVFINYHKGDEISHTINYEDRFLNPGNLRAISKSGRTLLSKDVRTALQSEEMGIRMHLFVRKNKDDDTSKEFYYLGRIRPSGEASEITMPNTTKKAVEIEYLLDTHVREDIYDYITEGQ